MKSVGQIARDMGVSPQAIYKRLRTQETLLAELGDHVIIKGGMKFDKTGENAVKALFGFKDEADNVVNLTEIVDNQVVNQTEEVDNLVDNLVVNRLYNEIEFLRSQLSAAEERNHELALKLGELIKSNQSLVIMLETKVDNLVDNSVVNLTEKVDNLVDNLVEKPKAGFWRRLFKS